MAGHLSEKMSSHRRPLTPFALPQCFHYFESFPSQYPPLFEQYGILSSLYLVRYSRPCMVGHAERVILKRWTYVQHLLQKSSVGNVFCGCE